MPPEVSNPQFGHQLDADTLLLYKCGEVEEGVYSGTITDEAGNHDLTLVNTPRITWGPAGKGQRDVFSRWFSGGTDELESAVIGVGSALRTHIV